MSRLSIIGLNQQEKEEAMLRGYQRKLIMIRTKESSIFESAFFILRGSFGDKPLDGDMIAEANKIVEECNHPRKIAKQLGFKHIMAALGIGFVLGAAVIGIAWITAVL